MSKEQNGITLHGDSLLSKWGFNDGDLLGDYIYSELGTFPFEYNHHKVLEELVKRYLLPSLSKKVEVSFMGTIHNPVRAEMIDGEYYQNWYEHDDDSLLPEKVFVTKEQIIEAIKNQGSVKTEGKE